MTTADLTTGRNDTIELAIGGMTCASCAARVEKKLNKIEGVTATVNYATEKAKIAFPEGVSTDDLVTAVQNAGYTASPAPPTIRVIANSPRYAPV